MILTEQQQGAVDKFSRLRAGALFMEMGTGKTLTALTLANLHASRYDEILWLAPVSTLKNAEAEIEKYGGAEKPTQFVGYESIASSDRIYLNLRESLAGKRIFLICDESLFLKNGETKRWQRTDRIRREFADFCLLLNGTPMSRNEFDIYWQMQLLSPLILDMSVSVFESTMFTKVVIKRQGEARREFTKRCQKNLPWLKSRIAPYVFECDLNIPVEVKTEVRYTTPSDEVLAEYAQEKEGLLDAIRKQEDILIMASLAKMKCLVANDSEKNAKLAKEVDGRRVVVFCEYREEQLKIVEELKGGAYAINGDTPMAERAEIIEEWKTDSKPLVTMTACASFGLNLQDANEVVFASLPWDYAVYSQALHRVYRLGQESESVRIVRWKQNIGIMRLVDECLERKITLAEFVRKMDWTKYQERSK